MDEFTNDVITGARAGRQYFRSLVGMGSRSQDSGSDWRTILPICIYDMVVSARWLEGVLGKTSAVVSGLKRMLEILLWKNLSNDCAMSVADPCKGKTTLVLRPSSLSRTLARYTE